MLADKAKLVQLKISIRYGWETTTVNAVQLSDLAVHAPIGWDDDYNWRITHVPTLTMFDKAVPEGDYIDEQLIQWCWKVQQTERIYFKELRAYNNSNYKNISQELLNSVKEYCLSIGV